MTTTATRLRATRLAAGYVVAKDASEALGIPYSSYRTYEAGTVGPTAAAVHAVTSAFGVDEAFVRTGKAVNRIELLAVKLAALLAESDGRIEDQGEVAQRLRQMRVARGFRTLASAAQAMGWSKATYVAHESGYNAIPHDRLIGYALSFGARPEYALLGHLPVLQEQPIEWKDRRAAGDRVVSTDGNAWSWLRSEGAGIPSLMLLDGRIELLSARLGLPAQLVQLPPFSKGSTYGLIRSDIPGTILIVDVTATGGPLVHATDDGISIGKLHADLTVSDPLRKRSFHEPVLLGTLVCSLSVEVTLPADPESKSP